MSAPATAHEENSVSIDWGQTDLYRFFAHIFSAPSRECFDLMASPGTAGQLCSLWNDLHCPGKWPGFTWFATFNQYESSFIGVFDVGAPEPPVPLFESAHNKSRPPQETALENTFFHQVLGLKCDYSRAVADSLVTQLEFLAALRFLQDNPPTADAAASLAKVKLDFLERHLLSWLTSASKKLDATESTGFPVLMKLLLQFVRNEMSLDG